MRDEIKAALIVCTLLLALALTLFFKHPVDLQTKAPPEPIRRSAPPPLPPAQFEQFLDAYGPPTQEEQSPSGSSRPPLFTKWLDYEPEHLRIAFIAAESPETSSGKKWVLMSFIDTVKTEPISQEEAARRLRARHK